MIRVVITIILCAISKEVERQNTLFGESHAFLTLVLEVLVPFPSSKCTCTYICTCACTCMYLQLFGRYQKATGANNMLWENGILTQLFLQVQRAEQLAVVASARGGVGGGGGGGRVRHWVVLDGPMEPALMECLAVMCSGLTRFSLANGEELKLPGQPLVHVTTYMSQGVWNE